MPTTSSPPPASPQPNFLRSSRGQKYGVWGGVTGGTIGGTAWIAVMAALCNDWGITALTVLVDIVAIFIFARLCFRYPKKRFLILALLVVVLVAYGLAIYWLRLDDWRAGHIVTPEALLKQKQVVSLTAVAMISVIVAQLLFMQWITNKSANNRR